MLVRFFTDRYGLSRRRRTQINFLLTMEIGARRQQCCTYRSISARNSCAIELVSLRPGWLRLKYFKSRQSAFGYNPIMASERKPSRWRLKTAGILFAIYLASFGAVMVADDNGLLARPSRFIDVAYAPLIWFFSLVSRGLK